MAASAEIDEPGAGAAKNGRLRNNTRAGVGARAEAGALAGAAPLERLRLTPKKATPGGSSSATLVLNNGKIKLPHWYTA